MRTLHHERLTRNAEKIELDRLVFRGVMAKISEPTDWVSGLVMAKKKNIRLTPGLHRSETPQSSVETLPIPSTADRPSKTYYQDYQRQSYFVCDVQDGYWHVQLDEEFSKLTAFATSFGELSVETLSLRLTNCTITAPAKPIRDQRLKCVGEIVDDVLVWGTSQSRP